MTSATMAVIGNLSPILFLTFRSMYGISYSLLGLLVVINFSTQLGIDLIFSFFSHKFNIPRTVKLTPAIAVVGLCVYALWPYVFPQQVYAGLVIGTVIFSAAGGLAEVLISPTIAAIPSKDPDREMSKLHSIFAWGSVAVIIFCTLFITFIGSRHWQFLALISTAVPLSSFILFIGVKVPKMETPEKASGALAYFKNGGLWLCVIAIFLGGSAECTMSQWCSGYLESALGIPKVWGDIFGVALFSVMLGLGRTLYAKKGKNLYRVLILGVIGATTCYLISAVSPIPVIGLLACAMTGICTSMLWPGNLVIASERFPTSGVFIYAMMAAGGDLGASVGPQLVGVMTDVASANPTVAQLAANMGVMPEQIGMKLGMLVGALFPLAAIPLFFKLRSTRNK